MNGGKRQHIPLQAWEKELYGRQQNVRRLKHEATRRRQRTETLEGYAASGIESGVNGNKESESKVGGDGLKVGFGARMLCQRFHGWVFISCCLWSRNGEGDGGVALRCLLAAWISEFEGIWCF